MLNITVFIRSEEGGKVSVWAEGEDVSQSNGIGPFADAGIAIFPQRYDSFGAIITWAEEQLLRGRLSFTQRVEIQGLLGSPWPHKTLQYTWAETHL